MSGGHGATRTVAAFLFSLGGMSIESAMNRLLALGGASPRREFITCGGVRLHVLEQGTGPALLLLHGGGGGGANWYRVLPHLARDYRVIAPDLPGFGLSDDVEPRAPLGLQAAELIADLLDELDIPRVSVLGTSFGGLAALRLAQHFPRRVHRLLLLDSAGLGAGVPLRVRVAALPLVRRWALRSSGPGTRWLLRTLLTSTPLEPDHEDALVRYLHAAGTAHADVVPRALLAFLARNGQRERCTREELAAVRAPTLLVWGERDRFFPVAHARECVACFRDARLEVLPQVGHSPNWEAPLELIDRIRPFLAAHE